MYKTFHYFAKQNTKNFTLFFYADIYSPKNYPHTLIYKYSKQPPFATYLVALLRKKLHPKSKKERKKEESEKISLTLRCKLRNRENLKQ